LHATHIDNTLIWTDPPQNSNWSQTAQLRAYK